MGSARNAVPETRKCLESPPSGFTVCLQAVALAAIASSPIHRYVSKETKHRRKKISYPSFLFVYTCQKKRNQISSECFAFEKYMRRGLKSFSPHALPSFCSLWCISVRCFLFLHGSSPLPVSLLTLFKGYCLVDTRTGFNIAVSSVELTGFGCKGLYFTDQLTWT